MVDELHFGPGDDPRGRQHELKLALLRLELRIEQVEALAKEILARLPQPTYPKSTGGTVKLT